MQLRFASYNIHKALGLDGKRDPERIITVLREVDADIIALQEADRRFGQRASVLPRAAIDDTPWKFVPVAKQARSVGWHGNALLIRRKFDFSEGNALDLPALEPRGAVMGEIVADGHSLRILGAHLDISGLRRSDQVRALLKDCAKRKKMPTAIMGDFNQWGRLTGAMRAFGISR
ncbi:MAG TPA: endonuclease, partial [Erythrobacter sp.]|nr:endonuclease [Erythrobacter sp.]